MKKLVILTVVQAFISLHLFAFDYASVLPQDTVAYLGLESVSSLKTNKSQKDFFKSKHYKKLKREFKKMISEATSKEEFELFTLLADNFSSMIDTSIAVSFDMSNVKKGKKLKPNVAFWINDVSLEEKANKLQKKLQKRKGAVKINKKIKDIKGIKVSIFKGKKELAYAVLGKNIVLTDSLSYMKKLISYYKNSSLKKLKNLDSYYKYRAKYKKLHGEFFLNANLLIQYSKKQLPSKTAKGYMNSLEVNNIKGIYGAITPDFFKIHVINTGNIPALLKAFVKKGDKINIPKYLPYSTFQYTELRLDLEHLYNIIVKGMDAKAKQNMAMLTMMLGVTPESLLSSLGDKIGFANFNKSDSIFFLRLNDIKTIISLIDKLGPKMGIKISKQNYMGAKLYNFKSPASMTKSAMAYKNNILVFGKKNLVKETLQRMSGKGKNFTATALYKKILNNKKSSQSMLTVVDQAYVMNNSMGSFLKGVEKGYGKKLNKKNKKMSKSFKRMSKILKSIKLEEWKTFLPYAMTELYIDKNDIVLESKSLSR